MAMHATFTRCLRTTPLSLFRQQIPKQQQHLSWSPKTTRAYSTNPPQGNNGSEKLAEKEAAAGSNSSETTPTKSTTTSSTNPETSLTDELLSEVDQRKDQYRKGNEEYRQGNKQYDRLMSNLNLRAPRPPPASVSSENQLSASMKGLGDAMQLIEKKTQEKPLERDYTKYPIRKTDTQPSSPSSLLKGMANNIPSMPTQKPRPMIKTMPMKLGPKLGRQIMVQNDRGMDCASAIRSLEVSCRSNDLRRQEANQRFHVRRGQARKNLRIRRWRKLFKFSFLETVKRIDRMRDQGW